MNGKGQWAFGAILGVCAVVAGYSTHAGAVPGFIGILFQITGDTPPEKCHLEFVVTNTFKKNVLQKMDSNFECNGGCPEAAAGNPPAFDKNNKCTRVIPRGTVTVKCFCKEGNVEVELADPCYFPVTLPASDVNCPANNCGTNMQCKKLQQMISETSGNTTVVTVKTFCQCKPQ